MTKKTLKRVAIVSGVGLSILSIAISPWIFVGEAIGGLLYMIWLLTGEMIDD